MFYNIPLTIKAIKGGLIDETLAGINNKEENWHIIDPSKILYLIMDNEETYKKKWV